jgi:hypothetical protein
MYILYLKESPLGLKYLGKCINKDPYKYMGSGKYWKSHLQKYGFLKDDIKTEILLETKDLNELKEKARYYSELWSVDKNKNFANLKPETGVGGGEHMRGVPKSEDWKKRMSERIRRPEEGKKISKALTGKKLSLEHIQKLKISHLGIKYSQETNKKRGESISKSKKGVAFTEEHKLALKKPKNKIKNYSVCEICGKFTTKTVISRNHGENKCQKR